LADAGLLPRETNMVYRVDEAQNSEHDSVTLASKQFRLGINVLDFKTSFYEVHEASTCDIFFPASLIIPLGICLLLGHQPFSVSLNASA
jgi:hypothetical protein